jgi:hypothetical protein
LDTKRPPLLFDRQDLELVELIDEFVSRDQNPERLRGLFNTYLHPHGIKVLAASRERRIAYAVIRLLDSLDTGLAEDRLLALRALRDEIIEGGDQALLLNSGRALLESMKHLIREHGSRWRRVELAHEFFSAVSGRPRDVRRQLAKYHLLEMSEQWNQIAFDHHVHDANTKGRKAPTHLIVDAWIKGIREMGVIYYFCVGSEAITELVDAAEIMGVSVQPGVEVSARFRGKFVQLIWTPRGLSNAREYLDLFATPGVQAFFAQGREVVSHHSALLLQLLDSFNQHQLARLNADHGLSLQPISRESFLRHVGVGQPSRSHLADYLHQKVLEHFEAELPSLRERWEKASGAEREAIEARVKRLDALTPDELGRVYLSEKANPSAPSLHAPRADAPPLLCLTPQEMVARLGELRSGSQITLNPSNLTVADVLELLFDCRGAITHLETFNLKDFRRASNPHMREIARLRRVLNSRNPITCKRMIREIICGVEKSEGGREKDEQLAKLHHILAHMPELLAHYAHAPLEPRMGSDSTGRARVWAGMGLAVMSTLPPRAQREFKKHPGTRTVVPLEVETVLRSTFVPRRSDVPLLDRLFAGLRHLPVLSALGYDRADDHVVLGDRTRISDEGGNVLTLGGVPEKPSNGLSLVAPAKEEAPPRPRWGLLNSNVKNVAKVLIGLLPAFLSFKLTNPYWVLAWFGAFIWFGITGFRNIIQAVVGGAGLIRSKLLRWTDLVRWSRISDSLLYTGLSVPLLDFFIKHLLLDRGLGITTANHPWLLYGGVGLANAFYLFGHNTFRGLPREAAFGNFLRPVFAVPLATGLSALGLKAMLLSGMGLVAANAFLQSWAAVLSKLSSDTVGAVIEGIADRNVNMRLRHRDYASKLARLLEVHGRLEAMFPNLDIVERLASPKEFFRTVGKEAHELERQQIINALDLMYLWMYQPRARVVFEQHLATRSPDERQIILRTQRLLERKRPISEMFINDLVGKNFSPPLAFYLDQHESYLSDMRALAKKNGVDWERGAGTPAEPREVPVERSPAARRAG